MTGCVLFGAMTTDDRAGSNLDVKSRIIQKKSKHIVVVSGIVESMTSKQTPTSNLLPTATDLRKARRIAAKLGSLLPCSECKRSRRKCGDTRPCERCIALGQSSLCVSTIENVGRIERPIDVSVPFLKIQPSLSFPPTHVNHQWAAQTVRAFWSTGYRDTSYLSVFNSLPHSMSIAMDNLLACLERYKRLADKNVRQVVLLPLFSTVQPCRKISYSCAISKPTILFRPSISIFRGALSLTPASLAPRPPPPLSRH